MGEEKKTDIHSTNASALRHRYAEKDRIRFKAYSRICVVAFAGTILSIFLFLLVLQKNISYLEQSFEHKTDLDLLVFEHQRKTLEQLWHQIESAYLGELQFQKLAKTSMEKYPYFDFMAWLPANMENLSTSNIAAIIKGKEKAEKLQAAKKYIMDSSIIVDAIWRSNDMGSIAVSRPFTVPFNVDGRQKTYLAFVIPNSYAASQAQASRAALVIAFLDVDAFFNNIFSHNAISEVNVTLAEGVQGSEGTYLLFKHNANGVPAFEDDVFWGHQTSALAVSRSLPFYGNILRVEMNPVFAYLNRGANWNSWGALLFGLLLTTIVIYLYYQQISRNLEIQRQVDEKTDALRSREQHLRALLNNTVDGIITINEVGLVKSFNPAAEKIFGYQASEVIGRDVAMLMPEKYHKHHHNAIRDYLKTGEARVIGIGREVEGLKKDGTTFPGELSLGEMVEGGQRFFIGIIRDVTVRKKVEDKIKEYNRDLVRSNQELDDFVYIVSHDLKEPLRGIYSYAHFLDQDYAQKLGEDGVKKIETLKNLAQRMEELIDSLLQYSRLGRTDLSFKKTNLNSVLERTSELLEPVLSQPDVTLQVKKKLPSIVCDSVRIGEVFFNLIANAVKYNESEQKRVEVGYVKNHEKYPGELVFYVADNGIGIPEKHRENVFKMFKRLHARDAYGGGTGSGLTIVKKIVDRHNGDIWVESGEEGTTFYFVLGLDYGKK